MSDSLWLDLVKQREGEWFAAAEQGVKDAYVYRYFDGADQLLYVGQTNSPSRRHSGHRANSPWIDLAARREVRGPMPKSWALLEEFVAIGTEKPHYNNQLRNGYTGPGSDHWAVAMADEFQRHVAACDEIYENHMSWLAGRMGEFFAEAKAS